jgi:glycosyltransferase involved in cell wall biosynthesis
MSILYITHDGLADHIGGSQILPYALGLSAKGFSITIVSAEKKEKARECVEIQSQLRAAGIRWHHTTFHNRPPLISTAFLLLKLYWISRRAIRRGDVEVIHCRGFLPAFIGLLLKSRFRVPVIFDFRDFWADRRLYSSPYKFVYRFIKRRERWLIRNADHIVTITEKAKTILLQTYFSAVDGDVRDRFTVIPTCADFSHFDPARFSSSELAALRERLGIGRDEMILGYSGSINPAYVPESMFLAFKLLQRIEPKSRFLFVSVTSRDEIARFANAAGVDEKTVVVTSATRADMPRYLSIFDLSIVFYRPDPMTAGTSPTKLHELFACNIPVLASAGVGDLDIVVKPEVNDSVLVHDFSEASLAAGIRQILDIVRSPERRGRIGGARFSLDEGVRLYQSVYERFCGTVTPVKPTASVPPGIGLQSP